MSQNAASRRPLLGVALAVAILATFAYSGDLVVAKTGAAQPIPYTAWGPPVNMGPNLSSVKEERTPGLSADGLSLYFDSDRPGGVGGRDIWVSQRATVDAPWGEPMNVGATINTGSSEGGTAFSTDGHWMFFNTDKPGGFGRADIYQSYRANIHDDFGWQTPTNLGANINSVSDDNAPTYFENGGLPQLFFGSAKVGATLPARPNLFLTNLQADGTWSAATLIVELSSTGSEHRPTISRDGLEIFFVSDRTGSVGSDLWGSTRETLDTPWSTPFNLGATLNTGAEDTHPYLAADGKTLYFSSNRPGGLGGFDLYLTTREQIFPATKDECNKGGWERFGIFRNQGDCVSYVATGGSNGPNQ